MYQNKIELIVEYYQFCDFMDRKNLFELETYNTLVMFLEQEDSSHEQIWEG
jgi:hypothetical protein